MTKQQPRSTRPRRATTVDMQTDVNDQRNSLDNQDRIGKHAALGPSAQQPSATATAMDSTVIAKHTRQSYTRAQKSELRAIARLEPQMSQRDLINWFYEKYGLAMNQSSLSCILSESRPELDSEEAQSSQKRRQRTSMFPDLEDALFHEQQQLQDQGTTVTSDMLKETGKRLWSEMDIYRDQPMPAFSNGWLQGFKTRYQMPVRGKKRKVQSAHTPRHPTPTHESSIAFVEDQSFVQSSEQIERTPEAEIPRPRQPPMPYHPRPAYLADKGSPLYADRKLYTRIAATVKTSSSRVLTHTHLVPPRSGYAWSVPAGHIVRIKTPLGPQVGDLNMWNLQNPRERFWAARTRQLHASHIRVFDRLWSCLPYLRPMVTVIADSLAGYGVDARGGRCHDLLGTRCDPYVRKMITRGNADQPGEEFNFHCHSNLTRAVLPWGLAESDVHDVLNVFQVTGLDNEGRYFMAPSPAVGASWAHDAEACTSKQVPGEVGRGEGATSHSRGAATSRAAIGQTSDSHLRHGGTAEHEADYLEFFTEIDVLMALSACPGGDLSCWEWSDEDAMRSTCRPLEVEVFRIPDAVRSSVLQGWKSPAPSDYAGRHGMSIPQGEQ